MLITLDADQLFFESFNPPTNYLFLSSYHYKPLEPHKSRPTSHLR
jgi:hypothetical protein